VFDHVHFGWLESDDYRVVAEVAGVVELPGGPEPERPAPDRAESDGSVSDGREPESEPADAPPGRDGGDPQSVLGVVLTGRWVDDDPGSVGK
jgi:hypothetical protein